MKEYQVDVYNINTFETIDTFIAEFTSIYELKDYMNNEIHNYKEPYYNISYFFTTADVKEKQWTNHPNTTKAQSNQSTS